MNWLISIYTRRDAVKWPDILQDLPKAIVWGLITGPLIAAGFQLALRPAGIRELFTNPLALLLCGLAGACFSVSYWLFMGLGNRALRVSLADYPSSLVTPIMVVYNMVGASLAFLLAASLVVRIPGPIHFEIPFFGQTLVIDALIGGVLAIMISSFIKLKKEVEAAQQQLREKALSEQRHAEAAAKAQALALQAQINPHFFFNTLNTISALIDVDPSAARDNVNRLADLFRYTLRCSQGGSVALEQELQFVRDYLEIEQARFQKRLRVEWPALPLPDLQVPGLVMQPLVENAVKHGIAAALEGGVVRISVQPEGDNTRIAVANTAAHPVDLTEELLYRTGHALDNVRSRLRLFTGTKEPLEATQAAGWTEMAFRI